MHLYRHISKVGGTTIRFIWDKNVVMGDWEYPIIYGFEEQQWTDLLQRWKAAAEKFKSRRTLGWTSDACGVERELAVELAGATFPD